ncbi:hypothetical protein [Oceanobacillus jordanicus]|jgi:hypothetical protein|uniref:Uncharacterized protein n=1 Tax=Oceanobacillus jordanicus TaxID=2867266 RepID=A0AAW5B6K3_9BACI|nr:hypothetical protein [Oceanobacillus jordanicus]MCG3420031.1 hypothetical protein [Oceanobacillus jordanicus]
MSKVLDTFKNMFLDLFSMGKGFAYGFVMVGLFIIACGAIIYGSISLMNLIF